MYGFSQKMDVTVDILKDALLQIVKLSHVTPFLDIPKYLHEKNEENEQLENKKQKLKEEIQTIEQEKRATEEKVRSSLKYARTTLVNIDIFVNTRDELESYGIHVEDIDKFARCLQGIRNYSNYDPFKVIQKFSDLKILENEIESKQKIKNDLEIYIKKLEETKFDYDNRLNLKHIKLKKLEELEGIEFDIQDLKKLKAILIEISSEHNVNTEQTKMQFFELLESYGTRIALEKENKIVIVI